MSTSALSFQEQSEAQALVEAIQFFSHKGWSPATSTNYSIRLSGERALISRSGVDKSKFQASDLIQIDPRGEVLPVSRGAGIKSSAETEIHLEIYRRFPDVHCVLHTHSALGTWLGQKLSKSVELKITGWEILKGLKGIDTHFAEVALPIVSNDQDMKGILAQMEQHWPLKPHGFLIAGHGLYSWGGSVFEAKRHIETFEFLFELQRLG